MLESKKLDSSEVFYLLLFSYFNCSFSLEFCSQPAFFFVLYIVSIPTGFLVCMGIMVNRKSIVRKLYNRQLKYVIILNFLNDFTYGKKFFK